MKVLDIHLKGVFMPRMKVIINVDIIGPSQ